MVIRLFSETCSLAGVSDQSLLISAATKACRRKLSFVSTEILRP